MSDLDARTLELLLRRAEDPERYERWHRQGEKTGWCRHPVRLVGSSTATEAETGEIVATFCSDDLPDRTLLKACGQRRATICPSCSATYRGDAFHLIAAGLRGGKGVPESITEHPATFATLTAPGFGAVHSVRAGASGPRACHPHPTSCEHRLRCRDVHRTADEVVGQPLCFPCWDYEGAILWNAHATDLWRRTTIGVRRSLARCAGLSERRLRRRARVSYSKVVEYQQRGLIHIHAVVRLDGAEATGPPPEPFTSALLVISVLNAATSACAPVPGPWLPAGATWGEQLDVHDLHASGPGRAAAYLAKYATKSTDAEGQLDHRLRPGDIDRLEEVVNPHLARLVRTAWDLGARPELEHLGLRRWAHTLGFRGHWLTKSRAYSTTFSALRGERQAWRTGSEADPEAPGLRSVPDWEFRGLGWLSPADQLLAEQAARDRLAARRAGWEER